MGDDIYPPEMHERPDFDLADFEGQSRKGQAWLVVLVVVVVTLMLYGTVETTINTALIRHTQTQNKPTVDNTNKLVAQQRDCLRAGGKCFERNQRHLAQILGNIRVSNVQVNSATVACTIARIQAHQVLSYDAIYSCVKTTVRLQSGEPQ